VPKHGAELLTRRHTYGSYDTLSSTGNAVTSPSFHPTKATRRPCPALSSETRTSWLGPYPVTHRRRTPGFSRTWTCSLQIRVSPSPSSLHAGTRWHLVPTRYSSSLRFAVSFQVAGCCTHTSRSCLRYALSAVAGCRIRYFPVRVTRYHHPLRDDGPTRWSRRGLSLLGWSAFLGLSTENDGGVSGDPSPFTGY